MTFSLHKLVGLPAIAAAAFFMQALDATILNTALPAVARSLDRSPLAMQLAVVGYTLTVAGRRDDAVQVTLTDDTGAPADAVLTAAMEAEGFTAADNNWYTYEEDINS